MTDTSYDIGSDEIGTFVDELYDTLRGSISPTPLYEITDGEKIDVEYLDGYGNLPSEDSMEVTVLDVNIASLFFDDFHVLYEGETGAGKTYGSETLFETVFGKEGYYSIEMRDDIMASSPTDTFTTLDRDEMKVRIDEDSLDQYGGMFIDELNRARDVNDIISLVDGEISVNGDRAELGLPIQGTDRKKGLSIIAAMNPNDAEYVDTTALDLAGVNRWVKFNYPDNVDESGAGQLSRDERDDMHEQLWDRFKDETGIDGDWDELYPQVTDPQNLQQDPDGRTSEFITTLIGFVGQDPMTTFERNEDLITGSEGNYGLNYEIEDTNNYLQQVREAQGEIRGDDQLLSRRDLEQINDTGQILGFIRGIKENGASDYDLGASLTDMVAAAGIVAETKRVSGTDYGELIGLVDDVRNAYTDIIDQFEDNNDGTIVNGHGLRETVWQSAVLDGTRDGFGSYQGTIEDAIETLNDTTTDDEVEKVLRSRMIADLAVLDHFSDQYRDEIDEMLSTEDHEQSLKEFNDLLDDVDRSIDKHAAVYDRLSFCR